METENLMSKRERDMQKAGSRRLWSVFYWLIGVVVIAATLGLIVYSVQNKAKVDDNTVANFEITAEDHTLGQPDAKVVLIEYSDLQCPSCKAFAPVLDEVVAEYSDRILFVYRHFPLSQIHFSANIASQAVEAADKQGKFWEMQKLIFANQETWSKAGPTEAEKIFIGYATDLKLDIAKFTADTKSDEVQAKINADLASGRKAGVSGTPTFYLNGKQVYPRTIEAFRDEFNKALIEVNVDDIKVNQ